ncbi:periplasmic heavy metal sensor [Desulfohalobiaceae bacterium Ax17]|uniref:periplasmic heavy metal sensor n=1 Tax=Desulfovulcanus ferrireducens TaxID=2831190 RepID=UPI00207BBCFB|nr:periplasmic heavy metal sensor [Desulfovulcanus ferrireducens]MBT8764481.1 periplasmic heavy metal sensor [Desulfovulcanus ferrireducens]
MNLKNAKVIFMAILAVLMVSSLSFASPSGHGQRGGMMGGAAVMPGYQGMYAQIPREKQEALQKIYQKHSGVIQNIFQKLYSKQLRLKAALLDEKIDMKKVNSLVDDISDLRAKLLKEQVSMQIELKKGGFIFPMMGRGMGMMGGMMQPGMMMGPGMMGPGMMHPGMFFPEEAN